MKRKVYEKTARERLTPIFMLIAFSRPLLWLVHLGCLLVFSSCQDENPDSPSGTIYFPPHGSSEWETVTLQDLSWNVESVSQLESLLEKNGTRAFIVLKNGKLAFEFYFGRRLAINQPFVRESTWYWASAGKTLTAATVGIAQHEGFLTIDQKTSDLLGVGWANLPRDKEDLISIRHQLTMTTGLDEGVSNSDDYSAFSLQYKADAGTRWAYHNAPYTILDKVITSATGVDFSDYFFNKIGQKIGMTGSWQRIGFNNVYFSDARSMARFGLLVLAKGKWREETILKDPTFFADMVHPSQDINPSYGYLWWLNGQSSYMLPGLQTKISGEIFPNSPEDLVCGLGRDGQYICVVPSENIVVIRMGENPDSRLVPHTFLGDIWDELNKITR